MTHLEQRWHHSEVVKHDTVEGAIDAVVDIVHKRWLVTITTTCITGTILRVQHWSLGKHVNSKSMCGTCKVTAYVKKKNNTLKERSSFSY